MPGLTYKQLEIAETAADYDSMAKKLFQLIFASKLEVPDRICCTHSEGKQLLDQELLRGIRCECYQGCIEGARRGGICPTPGIWQILILTIKMDTKCIHVEAEV